MTSPSVRLIAFYLPQFHPIRENNEWWGPGFTEWTNVAKAKPLFRGHAQPRVPADLGFYDLRVAETREAQAQMARDCGVEGFCYWHYWFGNGRRLLERPFEEVLALGKPDFPFCLAWANQSWTGIWHGNPGQTLIDQLYPGQQDEAAHFNWALRAFRDDRYMRVDGKPIFVVFAPHDMPSTASFIAHWRALAQEAGLPGIYFVAISNLYQAGVDRYRDAIYAPFDAVTPLTPQDYLEPMFGFRKKPTTVQRLRRLTPRKVWNRLTGQMQPLPLRVDYADVVARALHDMPDDPRYLPCVLPNWDNTPRSGGRGVVYENSTPALYETYLRKAVDKASRHPAGHDIVFLKAWNEWAEGNYLEPDLQYGHAYLDATRRVIVAHQTTGSSRRPGE
jgi:hypothetical protein